VVELVLHYRRTARHALTVLLGATEVHPLAGALPATVADGLAALWRALDEARSRGRKPVVAWSFYTASFGEVARELAEVRRRVPEALHLAGGPHASAVPQEVLRAGFDLCAVGEGEETLPAALLALDRGEDVRAVPGLAWLEEGVLRRSSRAPPVVLDAHPPLAPRAGRIGPIELSRGCAWACRFCQTPFLFRARFRHRSLREVRRWIRFQAGLAARDLRFLTPSALSFGADGDGCELGAIEALLAGAREEAGPDRRIFFGSFPSELRPEHVSSEALALIRRYCDNRTLIVGAQSGSERLLAEMGRGHGVEPVRRAVALALEAGFLPSVDLIFGLPGETAGDRVDTRLLAEELAGRGARVHAHTFMPLPGTPWSAEPPGAVDAETTAWLARLEASGGAHGQWRAQQRQPATPQGAARG